MTICRKHGKERNVIVKSKPSSRGKNQVFEYVGCEDCATAAAGFAAGVRSGQREKESEAKQAPGIKEDIKKPKSTEKKQTPAEAIEQAKKVRTIANRFGFKF